MSIFPPFWRAEAGLESIVQAAGRCNREGRKGLGDVFVFRSAGGKLPPGLGQLADAARNVMRHYEDPASLEAIEAYFKELYWIKGNDALDTKRILSRTCALARDLNFPFEGIAKDFRLIETWTRPVIVPYRGADGKDDTAERLLKALEWVERPGGIARRLQPFTVQIPPYALSALLAAGAVETLAPEQVRAAIRRPYEHGALRCECRAFLGRSHFSESGRPDTLSHVLQKPGRHRRRSNANTGQPVQWPMG